MRRNPVLPTSLVLETGIKIFVAFDALVVLGLVWLIITSDLFS